MLISSALKIHTTRAARVQLDRLAPDMPAARSTSTRTLRVCVADCALLDRGLGRQRRVFRGMEPLFRVTTHVMAGGRGRERAGARFVAVPAPFAPCTRHCGEKAIFQRRFQFISGINGGGRGRTKIPRVGIFYEYMLPPNQIWAHNSFSFKSYACTFAGKLLLISTIISATGK